MSSPNIDLATLPMFYEVVTRLCDSAGTELFTYPLQTA